MIFKDQDDCSKMLVCELNRMRRDGDELSESELFIADAFGSGDELDVAKPSLAFDIAAVIGREVNSKVQISIRLLLQQQSKEMLCDKTNNLKEKLQFC